MCAAPEVNGWLLRTWTSCTPSTDSAGVWKAFAALQACCHRASATAGSYCVPGAESSVVVSVNPIGSPNSKGGCARRDSNPHFTAFKAAAFDGDFDTEAQQRDQEHRGDQ